MIAQVLLAAAAALVMYGVHGQLGVTGPAAAGAALYGGAIALVNALLLARRSLRTASAAPGDISGGGVGILVGVLERFVFTLVAFALGIGLWKLCAPAMILGFAAPQLGFMLARQRGPQSVEQ